MQSSSNRRTYQFDLKELANFSNDYNSFNGTFSTKKMSFPFSSGT